MGERSATTLDGVFGALSDPSRRAILERLREGEFRVTEIAHPFDVSLNTVSKHIRVLERAGLVRRRVRGRDHYLSLAADPMGQAVAWMERYRAFWEQRLDALDAFLSERREEPGQRGDAD
jgi:DNA-binding transcriptional ArsR family regulator